MLFQQNYYQLAADEEFVACKGPFAKSAFADLQPLTAGWRAVCPLFFAPRRRWNSRVSAAKAMPLAANFLQKQQKQRERPFAKRPWQSRQRGAPPRLPRMNNPHRDDSSRNPPKKTGLPTPALSEQRGTRLGEFLDRVDEFVAVSFVESDRKREHAALGEPDAARDEIEIEEVAQRGVSPFGVFLRMDRHVGHVDREHRAEPGELHRQPVPARYSVEPLAQAIPPSIEGASALGRV